MQAILYRKNIPKYLAVRLFGRRRPGVCTGVLSPVSRVEMDPPPCPGPDWLRVRPRLCGICGSDLATVRASGSPYFSGITSMPFVLGHEVVGTVEEAGADAAAFEPGARVVLQPALGCRVRGIDPPCAACAEGQVARCIRVSEGRIRAGIQTGFCRDTGGGWSEQFVAHVSQLYRVPDEMPDETAVLAEPFACALHAVGRAHVQPGERVFVVGCGSVGLLTVAALRASGFEGDILAAARHPHQREHARHLGADTILEAPRDDKRRYALWSDALGAVCHPAALGKPTVLGGVDVLFDCVASSQSLDDTLRFTAAGGRAILVGMPAIPRGVDWTPLWYGELTVVASYAYGMEQRDGRRVPTFEWAIEILNGPWGEKLRPLVGSPYPLNEWRAALGAALSTGTGGTVKTVFGIPPRKA